MPTYEYACTDCGDKSEVVQRFSDDPLTICAECGGKLRKVFSPVGIVFKGSGFYRTDSRNGSRSNVAKEGAAKEGAAKGSNGSSADSSGGGSSSESAKNGSSGSESSSGKAASPAGKSDSSSGEKKSSIASAG